jgi:hypothetical protein
MHVVFLLAQDFHLGNLGTQGVCICNRVEDVR